MYSLEGQTDEDTDVCLDLYWPPGVSQLETEGTSKVYPGVAESSGWSNPGCWKLTHKLRLWCRSSFPAGNALGADLSGQSTSSHNVHPDACMAEEERGATMAENNVHMRHIFYC